MNYLKTIFRKVLKFHVLLACPADKSIIFLQIPWCRSQVCVSSCLGHVSYVMPPNFKTTIRSWIKAKPYAEVELSFILIMHKYNCMTVVCE